MFQSIKNSKKGILKASEAEAPTDGPAPRKVANPLWGLAGVINALHRHSVRILNHQKSPFGELMQRQISIFVRISHQHSSS
jgi:hypothetical protein